VEAILAIGIVLAGLLIIDRLFALDQRRTARKDPDGEHPISAAIMDFDGFLNPGRRHQIDERKRLEMMRDEVAPSDPRFSQIDLDSGTAVIRLPAESGEGAAGRRTDGTDPATMTGETDRYPPRTAEPEAGTDRT